MLTESGGVDVESGVAVCIVILRTVVGHINDIDIAIVHIAVDNMLTQCSLVVQVRWRTCKVRGSEIVDIGRLKRQEPPVRLHI